MIATLEIYNWSSEPVYLLEEMDTGGRKGSRTQQPVRFNGYSRLKTVRVCITTSPLNLAFDHRFSIKMGIVHSPFLWDVYTDTTMPSTRLLENDFITFPFPFHPLDAKLMQN
jgi:hypothetical protein